MHSCLSLSLLHHSEGGFYLISLCSKNFPAFLSSVFSGKKKNQNEPPKQMLFVKLSSCLCQTQNIHCLRCVAWKERMGKGSEGRSMNYPQAKEMLDTH